MDSQISSTSQDTEIDAQAVQSELTSGLPAESPEPTFRSSSRTQKLLGIGICGIGSALPTEIVTNEDLQRQYDFDPEWIGKVPGFQGPRKTNLKLHVEWAVSFIASVSFITLYRG